MAESETDRFAIRIAGITVGIRPHYQMIRDICRNYLTKDPEDMEASVSHDDILWEQIQSDREAAREKRPARQFDAGYLETLAVYRKIAENLIDREIILFHGSAIAYKGSGVLFTAVSGTGKSTHAALWKEAFPEDVIYVNDDKPLIRFDGETPYVCGTPWNGKHFRGNPVEVPLRALCFLERGMENGMSRVAKRDAWPRLLQQSYHPDGQERFVRLMELLEKMVDNTELYALRCRPDREAAILAKKTIFGEKSVVSSGL